MSLLALASCSYSLRQSATREASCFLIDWHSKVDDWWSPCSCSSCPFKSSNAELKLPFWLLRLAIVLSLLSTNFYRSRTTLSRFFTSSSHFRRLFLSSIMVMSFSVSSALYRFRRSAISSWFGMLEYPLFLPYSIMSSSSPRWAGRLRSRMVAALFI